MALTEPGLTWLVFNGDADGICAAHQLRLAGLSPDRIVTGVKRDIALLERTGASAGDRVVVADVSLDTNRTALERLLAGGVRVAWYDHHHAGALPRSPLLDAHIDTGPAACSSLIVDGVLGGRFGAWAIAAAFGDNLDKVAYERAARIGLAGQALEGLRELGQLMNYNAYGESIEDLAVDPAQLFADVAPYADPAGFIAAEPFVARLRACFANDMAQARALAPLEASASAALYVLPAAPWARRVNGVFANELARASPLRAHAVLVEADAGYMASVRAPLATPGGADTLCRQFATGGGRAGAAGVNHLPARDLQRFRAAFIAQFGRAADADGSAGATR